MLVLNYQVLATDWELSEGLLFEEDTALEAILQETDLDFGEGVDNGSSPRMQEEKRPAEVLCNLRRNSVRGVLLHLGSQNSPLLGLLDEVEVHV